jgi:hypothetical protein
MGVTGITYDLVIDPLRGIHAELVKQAKQAKSADQKSLRKLALKIATQLNRDVLKPLVASGTPPYASIYNWMAGIYYLSTGQKAPANGSPTYEDIITLQYNILTGLESIAGLNKFPQLDPKTIGQNHRVLVYLEAIFVALASLAQRSSFTASVSETIESQLTTPHHLAVAGYLDVCGQAVAEWKKTTYVPPPDSNNISDANWFPLYLKQIYAAFPPPK